MGVVLSSALLFVKLCLVLIFVANNISVTVEGTTESTSTTTTKNLNQVRLNDNTTTTTAPDTTTGPTTANDTTTSSPQTTPDSSTTASPPICQTPLIDKIEISDILTTQVTALLTLKSDENVTTCNEAILDINCTATEDWPWVIKVTNYTKKLSNDSSKADVELTDLSEYTTYSCDFQIVEGNLKNIEFKTLQDVPSKPLDLNVTQVDSVNFNFTWDTPEKVPTLLLGYNITITRGNVTSANHYWAQCDNETTYSFFVDLIKPPPLFFYFDQALADFDYDISISAWSEAGLGKRANTTVSTSSAASDPPRNVTHNVKEAIISSESNNIEMSLYLSWDMPCNTNGPVEYFVIDLYGYYRINDSFVQISHFNVTIDGSGSGNYNFTVPSLMAASNYSAQIFATSDDTLGGTPFNLTFSTYDNYPSAPEDPTYSCLAHSCGLSWSPPTNNPGIVTKYEIMVTFQDFNNWNLTEKCSATPPEERTYNSLEPEYNVTDITPDSTYDVAISAWTSRGKGKSTNVVIASEMFVPVLTDIVFTMETNLINEEKYEVAGIVAIIPGCFYGEFKSYDVSYMGSRDEINDHSGKISIRDFTSTSYKFNLRPEHDYEVTVSVQNMKFSSKAKSSDLTSPPGVPAIDHRMMSNIVPVVTSSEATLTLQREYFSDSMGTFMYLAIIVSDKNITGGKSNDWNGSWPQPTEKTDVYYQATPKYWNPFKDSNITSASFTIGADDDCDDDDLFCNKPLEAGNTYFLFLRVFNTKYYRNAMPIMITTDLSQVGKIVGSIFGALAVSALGFVGFILWRKGILSNKHTRIVDEYIQRVPSQNRSRTRRHFDLELLMKFLTKKEEEPGPKTEIGQEKFIEYCNYLENNSEELSKQWQELQIQSEEVYSGLENNIALLPENKRKNRFTNILPFDHSRVKLNIDEDDEICSDYINASFIRGFSNQNEYIATQGPLPHTVRDFWKMVFQEKVTIIVMVARFIENKREKCSKYFPNKNDTMLFGDDIEVRCSTELHFPIYCVRTLQVRKDIKQLTVTHMQFLEWPDFGVPQGIDDLIFFCLQFRERWASEGGPAVIHCSAGVGRTGTIMATDIIMQAIQAGKKIDVFNTVLELRRQRKCMVQTERQYLFIHQLIKSTLESPMIDEEENSEHLYQNIELAVATAATKNGLVESAL